MSEYIILKNHGFWNGEDFVEEYPDVVIYKTESKAEKIANTIPQYCEVWVNYGYENQECVYKNGDMRTFEGRMIIKWYPKDNGDVRPLTIDVINEKQLSIQKAKIKNDFMTKGENGEYAYSVKFDLRERL